MCAPSSSRSLLPHRRRHDATCCGWRRPLRWAQPAPASHRVVRRRRPGDQPFSASPTSRTRLPACRTTVRSPTSSDRVRSCCSCRRPAGTCSSRRARRHRAQHLPHRHPRLQRVVGLELWQPHGLGPDPRPTLLARPGTAGALTLLLEPVRVYDSRPNAVPSSPRTAGSRRGRSALSVCSTAEPRGSARTSTA